MTHLPQGFWARLHYLWERPVVKSIRITASIANLSVRLPAIAALLLAQGGALASTISLPMLAPLLLGTGEVQRVCYSLLETLCNSLLERLHALATNNCCV